ncbi:bidirectional sugar transporter SWEET14-like [Dendrobium catenatum]|uniref:Bidirectional sugar transporter SWEET15 n=1 Tax=Dendrobium catenatum TaxID=906689 RepID=A0A2I0VDC3_9ASPA|nr:bidirectional sugar transporter SWEET14-like [Dendrobium catenatum]PKU61408.1 Bidirectional sugar transporter SWEET15 [Dendrobium catenatum]
MSGNLISFLVFLAPVPTFYRVYKKKSTEGFHSLPYVIALFSCMLWVFFALVKTKAILLITINSFGLFIETVYIVIYLIYAPVGAKKCTIRMVFFLNVTLFRITLLAFHGHKRLIVLGWICVAVSVCVFLAPLSVMRLVIRTKSVEFIPFNLSLFLTISAAVWLAYGVLSKDKYIAVLFFFLISAILFNNLIIQMVIIFSINKT